MSPPKSSSRTVAIAPGERAEHRRQHAAVLLLRRPGGDLEERELGTEQAHAGSAGAQGGAGPPPACRRSPAASARRRRASRSARSRSAQVAPAGVGERPGPRATASRVADGIAHDHARVGVDGQPRALGDASSDAVRRPATSGMPSERATIAAWASGRRRRDDAATTCSPRTGARRRSAYVLRHAAPRTAGGRRSCPPPRAVGRAPAPPRDVAGAQGEQLRGVEGGQRGRKLARRPGRAARPRRVRSPPAAPRGVGKAGSRGDQRIGVEDLGLRRRVPARRRGPRLPRASSRGSRPRRTAPARVRATARPPSPAPGAAAPRRPGRPRRAAPGAAVRTRVRRAHVTPRRPPAQRGQDQRRRRRAGVLVAHAARAEVAGPALARLQRDRSPRRPPRRRRRPRRARPPSDAPAASALAERRTAGASASTIVLSPGPAGRAPGRPSSAACSASRAAAVDARAVAQVRPARRNAVPQSGPDAPPTFETSVGRPVVSSAPGGAAAPRAVERLDHRRGTRGPG